MTLAARLKPCPSGADAYRLQYEVSFRSPHTPTKTLELMLIVPVTGKNLISPGTYPQQILELMLIVPFADKLLLSPTTQPQQILELMLIVPFADMLLLSPTTQPQQILELMTGIEPVTSPLPRECSTD